MTPVEFLGRLASEGGEPRQETGGLRALARVAPSAAGHVELDLRRERVLHPGRLAGRRPLITGC